MPIESTPDDAPGHGWPGREDTVNNNPDDVGGQLSRALAQLAAVEAIVSPPRDTWGARTGVVVFDAQGSVTFANPEASRIMGTAEADLYDGRDAWRDRVGSYVWPDGRTLTADELPIVHALATGETSHHFIGVEHMGDGSRVWLACSTYARPGWCAVCLFREVTAADVANLNEPEP